MDVNQAVDVRHDAAALRPLKAAAADIRQELTYKYRIVDDQDSLHTFFLFFPSSNFSPIFYTVVFSGLYQVSRVNYKHALSVITLHKK